jgi:GH24 family phage-related lysozyme (muramidase)
LASYITQTQAEASKTPEEDKAFLGIAKQVKLLEKEAAADTTVGKPYAKSKINIMSQDVKVAWLQIEIQSSETEIKTLWIKNEAAIAKVAKPDGELSLAQSTAAWTKHPLQASNIASSTLIVGIALLVEMNDAKLSLRDNRAIDAQGNLWLKIDVLDDKNRPNKGWVLVNGEGAKRVCCWDWFDFTQIKETGTLKDIYLDADKSLKRNKDNHSLSGYKPTIKETLSILDKQYLVETNTYASIKEACFQGIVNKPILYSALSRLLVNYKSEWYSKVDAEGKLQEWEELNSEMTEDAKNLLGYLQTGDEAKFEAYLSSVGKAKDSSEAKGFETLRREISRFPADYKESPSKKLTKEQFESYAKMEALEKQVTAWEKTKEKIKKMLWWDDVAKGLSKLNQQNDTPPKNGEATSATTATTTATDTTPPATLSDDGKAWFIHPVTIMQLAAYKEIKFSKKGIAFLKKWEGLRLKPYDDQTGKTITNYTKGATIGIGHLIKSSEEFELYKNGINEATAEKLLSNDLNLKGYIKVVSENIKITLHQYEFDALVAFSFNIGIGGFKSSTVVKMINNPKGSYTYNSLEEAWLSWSNSQGKFNQGVNNRRRSEYYLFKNNKYTTYSHLDGEYKEI